MDRNKELIERIACAATRSLCIQLRDSSKHDLLDFAYSFLARIDAEVRAESVCPAPSCDECNERGACTTEETLTEREEVRTEAQEPYLKQLETLTKAIQVFRNEPSLADHCALRGTQGYIILCDEWDRSRDLLDSAPQPPASCPKCDSYAAMSWSGNSVYGNASSINAVKEAVHYARQVPELKDTIKALQAKVDSVRSETLAKEEQTADVFWNLYQAEKAANKSLQAKVAEQSTDIERLKIERVQHLAAFRDAREAVKQQTERITELEAKEFDWAKANAKCTDAIAKQAALIEKCERCLTDLSGMGWADEALAAIEAHRNQS